MSDSVYLDLAPGVSVGIPRQAAWSMGERELAKVYRGSVHGASRREARRWARSQIEARERARNDGLEVSA